MGVAYQHIRKRRPTVTVRAEWYGLWPKRGRSLRFWSEVGRRVKARRIPHRNFARIKEVCVGVERDFARASKKSSTR